MTGKMLSARHDAIVLEASHCGQSQFRHDVRSGAECSITDHRISGVAVHIQYRRHIHVDADGLELFGGRRGGGIGQFGGAASAQNFARRENRKVLRQP